MSQYRESVLFTGALLAWLIAFFALGSLSLYIPVAALCVAAYGKRMADRREKLDGQKSERAGTVGAIVAVISVAAVGAFGLYAIYDILLPRQ